MHGEHPQQPEALVEVTLDPPSTAVRKLGEIILDLGFYDAAESLSRHEQKVYALLAEIEPPIPRREAIRRLGYTSLDELSHIENSILTRLSRLLSEEVRASEQFQEIVEARKREHAQLLLHAPPPKPEVDEKPTSKYETIVGEQRPRGTKLTRRTNEVQVSQSEAHKRLTDERDAELATLRTTLREMQAVLSKRDKDVTQYLAPTQARIFAILSSESETAEEARIGIGYPQLTLLNKTKRIINRLTEKAADSLAFPLPPEQKPKQPLRAPKEVREKSPSQLERERISNEREIRLGELRTAIRQIDNLLAKREEHASHYLSSTKFRSYATLRDESKTNRAARVELNVGPEMLIKRSQLLIDILLEKAAHSLAFPLPPESESERREAIMQASRERVAAERDLQITELRTTLRAMEGLLAKRGEDTGDFLLPMPRLMNDLADVIAFPVPPLDPTAKPTPTSTPQSNSSLSTEYRAQAELEKISARRERERAAAELDEQITALRNTIRAIDVLLTSRNDPASDHLPPLQLRTYDAFRSELTPNRQLQVNLKNRPRSLLDRGQRLVNKLIDKAGNSLAFPIPPEQPESAPASPEVRAHTPLPLKPKPNPEPKIRPAKSEPVLSDMHYTQYIKAQVEHRYNGDVFALVSKVATACNVGPAAVRKALRSDIHPPFETIMASVLDVLEIKGDDYKTIKQRYMRERLPKVIRSLHVAPSEAEFQANEHEGIDESLKSALLQQLDDTLQTYNLDIRTVVPPKYIDVFDIIYGENRSWHAISNLYGLYLHDIAMLESRLIARIADNLPAVLAKQPNIQRLVKPHMKKSGSWRPAPPSALPSNHSDEAWVKESELREAIIEVADTLSEADVDPADILRRVPGPVKHLSETLTLLSNPRLTMVDIYRTFETRNRNDVTVKLKQILQALTDALPKNVVDTHAALATIDLPQTPGEYLRDLRRQLKSSRGDDVSVEQLIIVSGASESAIQKFFRGVTHPDVERILIPVARHLGVDEAVLAELVAQEKKLQYEQNERAQAGRKRPRSGWRVK